MQSIQAALVVAAIASYAPLSRAQDASEEAQAAPAGAQRAQDASEEAQAAPPAVAQESELFGSFQGTYLSVGGSAALGFAPTTGVFGGELSLVRQTPEFYWFGVYTDVVRDLARKQTRFSIGPEFGWSAFGLDLGYVAVVRADRVASGLSVRPMLTMGYATLFVRLLHEFSNPGTSRAETGLLLKYPFEL